MGIFLICMAGVILAAIAARSMATDNKPVAQNSASTEQTNTADHDTKAPIRATDIARTYLFNEALADVRFTGKPIVVSGRVIRIERDGVLVTVKNDKVVYTLWMSSNDRHELQSDSLISFRFTEDERGELAKLQPGQTVSIQGTPQGIAKERKIIAILDCKVVH
jgi:hypothetical protein